MATTTRTIRRGLKKDTRKLDYIYDENYIESSKRDLDRLALKTQIETGNMEPVPSYRNLFSELPHYPRLQMKLNYHFPAHVTREWRGSAFQSRQSWIRYQTLNSDLCACVPSQDSVGGGKMDAKGWQWYLYSAYRPRICAMPELTSSEQSLFSQSSTEEAGQKTVETQTDYRDGETQTDPFSPLYCMPSGDAPELISLATLSWGKGLPAGPEELQLIYRLRRRRVWEESLHGARDVSQMNDQHRVMMMIEAHEWLVREAQIESLMEAQLKVMKDIQQQKEEWQQKRLIRKMDQLWAMKQKKKESTIRKIRTDHVKAIHKLHELRARDAAKSNKRQVAPGYLDPISQMYAPIPRLGRFVDRSSDLYVITSKHLSTYEGLLDLEASLPDFVLNPRVKRPARPQASRPIPRPCMSNRDFFAMAHEAVGMQFDTESTGTQDTTSTSLSFARSVPRHQPGSTSEWTDSTHKSSGKRSTMSQMHQLLRPDSLPSPPSTPRARASEQENEAPTFAVTLLQQVIRGRAIQNRMFEGKEKHRDLINEMKTSVIFDNAINQKLKGHHKYLSQTLQQNRAIHEHMESRVDQAINELEGKSLGESLDFLSKELVRLHEERRIHALAILFERRRRSREFLESRKRQEEQRRRAEEDEIFKEIIKAHQCTVEGYLEQVISTAVDQIANDQCSLEMQKQAEIINNLAYDVEKHRDLIMSEEIVADLVHYFMVPEANKAIIREKVRRTQRRFVMAAHNAIYDEDSAYVSYRPSTELATETVSIFFPGSDEVTPPE